VGAIRTVHGGGSLLQPVVASRLIERLETEPGPRLTERELEVLRLLATGARNQDIAVRLSLSMNTVKFHLENIYQKLDANNPTQAVRVARERGHLST
jgi:DNA-binding NarL/FixJ family response regulator